MIQENRASINGPRIISWNTTLKCNLKCGHCYINAQDKESSSELNTNEGKRVIDQIVELGKTILVLSGGEPLLRKDIFEIAQYGIEKGLIVTLGTNGTLIDNATAKRLHDVGIRKVAISIDSSTPEIHDHLRGVKGAWEKAVTGTKACLENGVDVQFNVTMTRQNHNDLDQILDFAKSLGVKNIHLFFLVPTGRGKDMLDLSPETYEQLLRKALSYSNESLEVKPTCAPQFMRLAKQMGLNMTRWSRGCIAGINYCRILPDGQVTPCPYLPVRVGSLMEKPLKEIWKNSKELLVLRDFSNLKGKCGKCDYKQTCGGCRARAYGLTSFCSGATAKMDPENAVGDFLAEDPWCTYKPNKQ